MSSNTHLQSTIHTLQLSLLDPPTTLTLLQLQTLSPLLSRPNYQDVVTERSNINLCGYPLCNNPLPKERTRKGKYRISLSQHKVYDLNETYKFCCSGCLVDSSVFSDGLEEGDGFSKGMSVEEVDGVVRKFMELGKGTDLDSKNGDLGFGKLTIKENVVSSEGSGVGKMEEWVGPSGAIEGYVPISDRKQRRAERLKKKAEGSNSGSAHTKKGKEEIIKKSTVDTSVVQKTDLCDTTSKSCMRTLGPKNLTKNVSWADQNKPSILSSDSPCEIIESGESSGKSNIEGFDKSVRLEAAEACADAMIRAAEAVASGETEVTDAISEAGIVILPSHDDAEMDTEEEEDILELQSEYFKWPKIGSESEHPWFEFTPPDGFNLNLSLFATIWKSLSEWITSSSLAFIYGRDESSWEEFSYIEGKFYPLKVFSDDLRSSEIKQTFAECMSRVIAELIKDLKLPLSSSAVEREMAGLVGTMSFMAALPPFKGKQWKVVAILLMDVLSVSRIPRLAELMTSKKVLMQQVLDVGQVSIEDYNYFEGLVLPLGRVSDFSAQKGC